MWRQMLTNMGMTLLAQTVQMASPIVSEVLANAGREMYLRAKKTPNPFDDILAVGILSATGQPTPTEPAPTDKKP